LLRQTHKFEMVHFGKYQGGAGGRGSFDITIVTAMHKPRPHAARSVKKNLTAIDIAVRVLLPAFKGKMKPKIKPYTRNETQLIVDTRLGKSNITRVM
jgi:hypothetical protein